MMQLKAQTSGWHFVQEPEARWLAVEALLIATRFNRSFGTIYLGALGEALIEWQKKHFMSARPDAKLFYPNMSVVLDNPRMDYLSAKRDWDDVHSNELIPLGRVLDFMVQGHSQRTAINKTIRQYKKIRDDISKSQKEPSMEVAHIESWPDGYKHLSYDSFQKRFGRFKCVLPYVHIYFRNRDYNAWADVLSEDCNHVILPHEFSDWNATLWEQFEITKRVRLRAPNEKISLNFQ